MSSQPLAALAVQPQQPQDPLQEFARVLQVGNLQQQLQSGQTQNQIGQLQLAATQRASQDDLKWRSAITDPNWDGTIPGLLKAGLKQGVGLDSYTNAASALTKQADASAALGTKETQLRSSINDEIGNSWQQLLSVPPAQRPAAQAQEVQRITGIAKNTPGIPPDLQQQILQSAAQIPTDAPMSDDDVNLRIGTTKLAGALLDEGLTRAKTSEANTQAALGQIKVNLTKNSKPGDFDSQIDALAQPGTSLNVQAKALVNGALSRGDVDGAKQALDQTFQQVGKINEATNPAVISAHAQEAAQTATAVEQAHQKMYPAALAGVPQNLIQPASADATKADQAYTQALQAGNEMQNMVKLAKGGNKIAYAYSPVTGVLQINVAGQVKRVNMPEIESYGAAGSALDNIKGYLGKKNSGASIPAGVLNDMDTVSKMVTDGAQTKYQQDISNINSRYGAKFQPMQTATPSTTPSATPPPGATHIAKGNDGKNHYTNANGQDLGVAP